MHTKSSAAKQPVVRFTCPHCKKTLQGQTLTNFLAPSEFAAPATGIKKAVSEIAIALLGLPDEETLRNQLDFGKRNLLCPACQTQFPAADIRDLEGELMLKCPGCEHTQLRSPIATHEVVCCVQSGCRIGFTVGVSKDSLGAVLPPPKRASDVSTQATTAGRSLELSIGCRQATQFFEYGNGKNEQRERVVRGTMRVVVEDPESTSRTFKTQCEFCDANVQGEITSWQMAAKKANSHQRLARYARWLVIAAPLAMVYGGIRWLMISNTTGATVPLDANIVGLVAFFLALIGAFSWPAASNKVRDESLKAINRIRLTASPTSHVLWREGGMYTKGASLEISHELCEAAACAGPAAPVPAASDATQPSGS